MLFPSSATKCCMTRNRTRRRQNLFHKLPYWHAKLHHYLHLFSRLVLIITSHLSMVCSPSLLSHLHERDLLTTLSWCNNRSPAFPFDRLREDPSRLSSS